ncbi:MAG: type I glyceraldehyde-3-phosphate dehydrogenase [Dehalococcoidales bacterium]|nr:type I glyceraldehyde-3-phosphate dehydrogenase [Dehalococcoidales bacterium]
MITKIGINGFGRTARLTFKAIDQHYRGKLEVVAINGRRDAKTYAHLLKWDSTYGRYPDTVEASDDSIIVGDSKVKVLRGATPSEIPWQDYDTDIVIEATGQFTDATKSAAHLKGSVKKVLISAPAKNEDVTVVIGVNEDQYDPKKHSIISNASCTTNCIAPVVKVLHQNFGITKGLMSTIHAYTNDQQLLDKAHPKDPRRARAAALSIIPTTTGAAKAVTQVIPELEGKLQGLAFRVPVATVSIVDFVAELARGIDVEQVNQAFRAAAEGPLKGILEYCQEPLVGIDFKGNPASSIVDAPSTMVIGSNMVKVLSWYDNEWGYSCRLADLSAYIASKGL